MIQWFMELQIYLAMLVVRNIRVRSVTFVFCSTGFVKAVEFVFPVDTEIQWKFSIELYGLAEEYFKCCESVSS